MNLPLYMKDFFGYETGLVLVTLIGFLFGFVLERSGFGRAPVLASQFYFRDMRVLKVMFSAIATALLGLALLGGLGVVDLPAIAVPPSHLWPMVIGGFLLGVGFVVSGYCPGTAVVSTASGNIDGIFAIIGIVLGSLLFGFAYPLIEGFYNGSPMKEILFPELLGVPHAILAFGVLIMAVGAFLGGEKLERVFAKRDKTEAPDAAPALRNKIFAGLGVVGVVGLLTLQLEGKPSASSETRRLPAVSSLQLAQRLVRDPSGYHLVDLRPAAECRKKTIPGAVCLPATGDGFIATLPATRKLVLFGARDLDRAPASATRFGGSSFVLSGGFEAFRRQVLTAPAAPGNPTPEAVAAHRLRSALHAYFTGSKAKQKPIEVKVTKVTRKIKKGGGC